MQGLNVISIHALLAESDLGRQSRRQDRSPISIHALLAESDQLYGRVLEPALEFLSTLSLRRATFRTPRRSKWGTHFYPRSPCGERRLLQNGFLDVAAISIHALLAESDPK